MIRAATIARLGNASIYDLREIRYNIDKMGVNFHGPDGKTWGTLTNPELQAPDLIAIRGRHNTDDFSTLVTERLVSWYNRHIVCRISKTARQSDMVVYQDNKVLKFTRVFTHTIACLLPIACISILYSVESDKARLGLIATFAMLFVACITFFTQARTVDVFTAISA